VNFTILNVTNNALIAVYQISELKIFTDFDFPLHTCKHCCITINKTNNAASGLMADKSQFLVTVKSHLDSSLCKSVYSNRCGELFETVLT